MHRHQLASQADNGQDPEYGEAGSSRRASRSRHNQHQQQQQGGAIMLTGALLLTFSLGGWLYSRLRNKVIGGSSSNAEPRPSAEHLAHKGAHSGAEGTKNTTGMHTPVHAPSTATPLPKAAMELIALYGRMAEDFQRDNLNTQAIQSMQPWFHGLDKPEETPWPKKYSEFPHPLPHNAVRILVIPMEYSPELTSAAAAVARSILQILPPSAKVFANSRTHYHCTMFHTSQPTDPRPRPWDPDGGVPSITDNIETGSGTNSAALRNQALLPPPHERRGPTDDELQQESSFMRSVVASVQPPLIKVDRVLFANSGTLLITWVDATEHVAELRTKARQAFPGASTKQAGIIHTTLLRVLNPEKLPQPTVDAIVAKCNEWTQRLNSQAYRPPGLWFVREHEFSTIVGDKETMPLMATSAS